MNSKPKNFSKYLVIFVDILGSKNMDDFQEAYRINTIFHEEFQGNENNDMLHTVYQRKVFTFSDCAYIFYSFKEGIDDERKDLGALFKVALCNCEPIFLRLINEKILFRGGISYGDAYVDSKRNMFFGSAVIDAYRLESEIAMHPRIVVDKNVVDAINRNIETTKYKVISNNLQDVFLAGIGLIRQMPECGEGIVEKDVDGQYIFNYLHFPENNMIIPNYYSSCELFLKGIIEYCKEQIKAITTYKVIDKYYYLLRFSEGKLQEFFKKNSQTLEII